MGLTFVKEENKIITLSDDKGYLYVSDMPRLKLGYVPKRFDIRNPYTLYNIGIWLKVNNKPYELVSEEYKGCNEKIILKDNIGYLYSTTWNRLELGIEPNFIDTCNPFVIQNIKLWLKNNNNKYELFEDIYKGNHKKMILIDKDGYLYTTSWGNLHKGQNPNKIDKSNPYTIHNIKLWLILNSLPIKLISEEYLNSNRELEWKCLKDNCGEIFKMSWNCIQQGIYCNYCSNRQVGLSNCLVTKYPELASEWHPTKNGDLTPYDVCGGKVKYWWICEEGHEWKANISNRINGRGCPDCRKSKGEIKIKKWLEENNIFFIEQYTFDNLVSTFGNSLRFDFAIFEDIGKTMLKMLIEFDGEQHYRLIKGWYTKARFKKQQIHDKSKNTYCKLNNIKLVRIPWFQEEKLEKILEKWLLNK